MSGASWALVSVAHAGYSVKPGARNRTGFSALCRTANGLSVHMNSPSVIPALARPTGAGRGSPLCRRITAKLKEEHWGVNRKRVPRLWRAEGLKVPTKTHQRTRLGNGENACHRHKPEHAHQVWAVDLLMDTTLSGGRLKFLTVIDAYSRACLSIKVERTLTRRDVVARPERLITLHGPPTFSRCDNGPEFISQAAQKFLSDAKVETLFIEPGSPWQHGYRESFNSRLRDELLNLEAFASSLEARVLS